MKGGGPTVKNVTGYDLCKGLAGSWGTLAVFSEVRLVAAFWLRAGNSSCANNVVGFFLDLWEHLPSHLRVRVVRADSGFCVSELLRLWERLRLKFVVVARLSRPLQQLIRKETCWHSTEVAGTDVAEVATATTAETTRPTRTPSSSAW